jgi:hypothetical protein
VTADRWPDARVFGPPPTRAYPDRQPIVITGPDALLDLADRRQALIAGRKGAGRTPVGGLLALGRRLIRRPTTHTDSYSE